jgi:farnesyl diphosphate synthase
MATLAHREQPSKEGNTVDYQEFKTRVRADVERILSAAFDQCGDTEVCKVGRYISLGGGHRWRALVAIAAGEIFNPDSLRIGLPGAAGVELAHAASLILDDLPSMDDGQKRRGKPCAHRVFQRWAVDMAPVFLVTLSYEIALRNELASSDRRVQTAVNLSRTGLLMIAGQSQDVQAKGADSDEVQLLNRYRLKSGSLYAAAAQAGAILCGADESAAETIFETGMSLGLSYQYLDDVADAVADSDEVGKDTRCDADKPTAVSLYGVDGARRRSHEFQEDALSKLASYDTRADRLRNLVSEASWARA